MASLFAFFLPFVFTLLDLIWKAYYPLLYFYPFICSLIKCLKYEGNQEWCGRMHQQWLASFEWSDAHEGGVPGEPTNRRLGFPLALGVRFCKLTMFHSSGLFIHRTIQRLRLGDDVRHAAHCIRHRCFCLRVLQPCWVQQKLSQRERWGLLHVDAISLTLDKYFSLRTCHSMLPGCSVTWTVLGHWYYL